MPPLLNLKNLQVVFGSKGLNDWTCFPPLNRGLDILELDFNDDIQGDAMDRILTWAEASSSKTLSVLHLDGNDLTTIEDQHKATGAFLKMATLKIGRSAVNKCVKCIHIYTLHKVCRVVGPHTHYISPVRLRLLLWSLSL